MSEQNVEAPDRVWLVAENADEGSLYWAVHPDWSGTGQYAHLRPFTATEYVRASLGVDCESLLRTYIRHVRECEGVDFIQHGCPFHPTKDHGGLFEPEEWKALNRLAEEARAINGASPQGEPPHV